MVMDKPPNSLILGMGPNPPRNVTLPKKLESVAIAPQLLAAADFSGLFEVGVGWLFLEIEAGKGTRSTRSPRRRLRASRGRGDPDGREELQR
jgi:hypothetical protein